MGKGVISLRILELGRLILLSPYPGRDEGVQ
ncbi:hypothetical protein Stok01_02303 [Sulfurisphaera tokodaii]